MEEDATSLPPQPFDPTTQQLQSPFAAFPRSHSPQPDHDSSAFTAHLDPTLQALDSEVAFSAQFGSQLENAAQEQHSDVENGFARRSPTPFEEDQSRIGLPGQQRDPGILEGGQFAVLVPQSQATNHTYEILEQIQQGNDPAQVTRSANGRGKKDGHFANMKMIPNPPNLQSWRERLFDVNETITLSERE